ncbi:hypothetical protein [Treponema sp.]|uniref:hypothetical protein n=1 Tax=Treponema sp. TaxID=166 RepID=UPI00298D6C6C|nr:hypothetical protein [Treponema sp.]
MATTKEYHDYVMECLEKAGEVTSRKMMGEYCLYYNGKPTCEIGKTIRLINLLGLDIFVEARG